MLMKMVMMMMMMMMKIMRRIILIILLNCLQAFVRLGGPGFSDKVNATLNARLDGPELRTEILMVQQQLQAYQQHLVTLDRGQEQLSKRLKTATCKKMIGKRMTRRQMSTISSKQMQLAKKVKKMNMEAGRFTNTKSVYHVCRIEIQILVF
jgi:hypothetical protein